MNLNKIFLVGRVTKQPEVKKLPSGMSVASFGLATNHVFFKGPEGQKEKVETTQFHNIKAWGRQADTIGTYIVKGQEILVEGRVEYRSWDGQDGQKKYATEIVLETFQFGAKPGNGAAPKADPAVASPQEQGTTKQGRIIPGSDADDGIPVIEENYQGPEAAPDEIDVSKIEF